MSSALPETKHLLGPTHRVLAWSRVVLAAHACVFNLLRLQHVTHPTLMMVASALTLVWSVILAGMRQMPSSRRRALLVGDILLAVLLTLASRWVLGGAELDSGFIALPVFWQAAAPVTIAVWWGPGAGLCVGLVLALVSLPQTRFSDPHVWSSSFAICLVAWGTGQLVEQLRVAAREREHSFATSVALAERDRMSRIVHDGALQVLSLVEREGRQMGPRGQRLAQLARVQEIALRAMLQDRTVHRPGEADEQGRTLDVASMLDAMSSERVTVSLMAGAVMMPQDAALELKGAVGQIILNAELHAGPDAHVWMLLESEDDALVVSVRDNGVGMTPETVREALDSGRLGIRHSIIGRIRDLGGTAEVTSTPGRGVEWELRVPLDPVARGAAD